MHPDCASDVWPLSRLTDIIGFIAYHGTSPRQIASIKKDGLGEHVSKWMALGGYEHHTWYLFCLLDDAHQEAVMERFGRPPYMRIPMGWDDGVLAAFKDQYPNAYMTWVSEEVKGALDFGGVVIEIRLEDVEKMSGFMFPDHAYGWGLITVGRRIPGESLYVLTEEDLEEEAGR